MPKISTFINRLPLSGSSLNALVVPGKRAATGSAYTLGTSHQVSEGRP